MFDCSSNVGIVNQKYERIVHLSTSGLNINQIEGTNSACYLGMMKITFPSDVNA